MDIERTTQSILEQQAQFSTYQARFANDIVQINTVLLDVATTQDRTNAILATLAERRILTEKAMARAR